MVEIKFTNHPKRVVIKLYQAFGAWRSDVLTLLQKKLKEVNLKKGLMLRSNLEDLKIRKSNQRFLSLSYIQLIYYPLINHEHNNIKLKSVLIEIE